MRPLSRLHFPRFPSVDTLICNAGIAHYGLISDISGAEWDQLFAVNVKGIYHCVRAALPHFLRNQAGNLITISSMWGQAGVPPVRRPIPPPRAP